MAWEAVTKASVAALAGCSVDQLRDEWYDMAVALIAMHAGIHNIGNITTVVDYLDGTDMTMIRVSRPPINSVSSVYVDDRLVLSKYYTHTDSYIVLLEDISIDPHGITRIFEDGLRNVKVTYESGATSDPAVALAISLIVKELANTNTSEGAASRLQFYAPGRTMATQKPLTEYGLHGKIKGIIDTLLPSKLRAS